MDSLKNNINSSVKKEIRINDKTVIKVIKKGVSNSKLVEEGIISSNDAEMDSRARTAVSSEKRKARICKKPIAVYDKKTKEAYMVDSEGKRVKN